MSDEFNNDKSDRKTHDFLKCMFPSGLSDIEYFHMLYIISHDMTIRAASSLLSSVVKKTTMEIYNDVLFVKSSYHPDLDTLNNLKYRLNECGYQEWLNSF